MARKKIDARHSDDEGFVCALLTEMLPQGTRDRTEGNLFRFGEAAGVISQKHRR